MDTIEERLEKVEEKLRFLMNKRITQVDVIPDSIKMRAIGEGVRFIRGGVTAGKPTTGEAPMQGIPVYYDKTVNKLYAWNGTAWVSSTFA